MTAAERPSEAEVPVSGWEVYERPAGVHVVPKQGSDVVLHALNEDCICGPTTEAGWRPDGSNGWLYTHHSLDGREQRESTP